MKIRFYNHRTDGFIVEWKARRVPRRKDTVNLAKPSEVGQYYVVKDICWEGPYQADVAVEKKF